MAIALNRRMALVFGLAVPLLQGGRILLWGHWSRSLLEWPFAIDAYLVGALLLLGFVLDSRKATAGRLVLSAGWGFACGILYRSFFEQLADPSRHAGHEILVLAIKGALLVFAATGLVVAVRTSPVLPEDHPLEMTDGKLTGRE
jgi:hypothetical protein